MWRKILKEEEPATDADRLDAAVVWTMQAVPLQEELKKKLMSVLKKNVKLKEKIFHQFEREKERTITLSQKKNEEKIKRLR